MRGLPLRRPELLATHVVGFILSVALYVLAGEQGAKLPPSRQKSPHLLLPRTDGSLAATRPSEGVYAIVSILVLFTVHSSARPFARARRLLQSPGNEITQVKKYDLGQQRFLR